VQEGEVKQSINARFLEEAKAIEARWAKTGLLKGISKRWDRQVTAVLLEGQRLMNERADVVHSSEKCFLVDKVPKK
jgi:hypothetical protein